MCVEKQQGGFAGEVNPETKGLGMEAWTTNILLLVETTHKSTQWSRPQLSHSLSSSDRVSTSVMLMSPEDEEGASPPMSFSWIITDQLSQVNTPWGNYLIKQGGCHPHVFSRVWSIWHRVHTQYTQTDTWVFVMREVTRISFSFCVSFITCQGYMGLKTIVSPYIELC